MAAIDADLALQARLFQAALGITHRAHELPGADGDVFVDEEGTPMARRVGGRIELTGPSRWPEPDAVRSDAPVVLPPPGRLPVKPVPDHAVLLLPAAGVRPDDARYAAWARAWSAAANRVVPVPIAPDDLNELARALIAAYTTSTMVTVDSEPQPAGAGRTLLFTGLSGSGKSTIAKHLVDRLFGERTITLLDGDVVRTHLSRGLGFSREDRDINIRRIGWVAAEVTKHGGLAVCAPIAPYDATRQWVRRTVEAAGGPGSFLLVWVSTPLEVCEARDVKGLYAKARAGELKGFTGIDDPYEPPADADLVIDTSVVALDDAVEQVMDLLAK
ncbi:MAG TPA: adenylyl-sulfate kinase [Mycobacteriales bacterium]|nr:adenylyl-sulfate kinase [Mycobacteriales bacterium]